MHSQNASVTAEELRLRLRESLHKRGVSQSELVKRLSAASGEEWLIAHVSKIINGHIRLRVEDLLLIAQVADLSLVELFREPGRELVADLTPTELRLVHALRDHAEIMRPLVDVVLLLTPTRKTPRAILRERMRRAKAED